jgi:nucleoid-associated protein YgaU
MLIAQEAYGSRTDWVKLYEANKDTIENPAMIYPGQMIVIPAE